MHTENESVQKALCKNVRKKVQKYSGEGTEHSGRGTKVFRKKYKDIKNKVMKKVLFVLVIFNLQITFLSSVHAGGMMSNTNQNAAFIRNPARDGVIAIDGVYSNPAGVALMPEGWHISLNWQYAWQRRIAYTDNPVFAKDAKLDGATTRKRYRGIATAPFIPSVQAAYNWKKFSFQGAFAVAGGGGKCEFKTGLGSFDAAVGNVWAKYLQPISGQFNPVLNQLNSSVPVTTGYSCNSYMEGRQYYFGVTLGTAYKIVDTRLVKVSAYAGVRFLYGMASYKAEIKDIKVAGENGTSYSLREYSNALSNGILSGSNNLVMKTAATLAANYASAGMSAADAANKAMQDAPGVAAQSAAGQGLQRMAQGLSERAAALEKYYDGVYLQSDQNGFGVCPIIGLDVKVGMVNLAMKYEFRTKMNMKNNSTVEEAGLFPVVNQFVNGTKVREDTPALLTLGIEIEPIKGLRIDGGYHHFYDRNAKKTYFDAYGVRHDDKNSMLSKGTDEFLAGVEYDFGKNKRWTVSGGIQTTTYGNTDEYMSDLTFVTNSWSFGTGIKYKINDKLSVNAGYFQTNYRDYEQKADYRDSNGSNNTFTRRNRVFAAGLDIDL